MRNGESSERGLKAPGPKDPRGISLYQDGIATQDVRESEAVQAQADVEAAKSKIESANAAVATAEAAIATVQAQLAIAELNLSYTEVRAPVTGRVSSRVVTEGNLVSGGTSQAAIGTD